MPSRSTTQKRPGAWLTTVATKSRSRWSSSRRARSSAASRSRSSVTRAAATTASTSSGSWRSDSSWTSAATGRPSYAIGVVIRPAPSGGSSNGFPAMSTYALRSGSQ